jgi:hypothetical protein
MPAPSRKHPRDLNQPAKGVANDSPKRRTEPKVFEIKAYVEGDSHEEVRPLVEAIERAICPFPPGSDHACPRGWFLITSELDEEESAYWRPELNR